MAVKLLPWQLDMLNKLEGFKPGEMVIYTAGRGAGKSMMTKQFVDRLMQDLMNRPVEDLVLSEGRVYGARYHCVEPVGGNWRMMEDWCIDTFGSSTGSIWAEEVDKKTPQPGERWYANNRRFWFRNESDRTMFILRWS
jgi:hypothetical protein